MKLEIMKLFVLMIFFMCMHKFGAARRCNPETDEYMFVYDSFMISENIVKVAPNTEVYGIGFLNNYSLDFGIYDAVLQDTLLTAAEDVGAELWGVVYCIPKNEAEIFKQTIFNTNDHKDCFETRTVLIEINMSYVNCQAIFTVKKCTLNKLVYGQRFPLGRRPSAKLMEEILKGAEERRLPINYRKRLQTIPAVSDALKNKPFYLFAYGGNMYKDRVQAIAPSASYFSTGKVKNVLLNCTSYVEYWEGCVYTYVPSIGGEVWGIIWQVEYNDLVKLDEQGGITVRRYEEIEVDVVTDEGEVLCITYQIQNLPSWSNAEDVPSKKYHDVIVNAAVEYNFPTSYIDYLKSFPTK